AGVRSSYDQNGFGVLAVATAPRSYGANGSFCACAQPAAGVTAWPVIGSGAAGSPVPAGGGAATPGSAALDVVATSLRDVAATSSTPHIKTMQSRSLLIGHSRVLSPHPTHSP